MFTGEYRHSVDDKGRLAVPARFRAQLDDGALVCSWIDGCLAIFPRRDWDDLTEKVRALPITDPGARMFRRFLFGGAFEFVLDRQGRLVVPTSLRDWAELSTEAVVVGALDHAEIWSPGRWDEASREIRSPEALAQHLTGLGI